MNLRHELNKLFIKDITERPNDWEVDDYTLIDILTKRRWWICNGGTFFGQYSPIHSKDMHMFWFLNKTHRRAWRLAKHKAKELRYERECMQWMDMEREADLQIADYHQRILDQATDEQLDQAVSERTPFLDAFRVKQEIKEDQEGMTHLAYSLEKKDAGPAKSKKRTRD